LLYSELRNYQAGGQEEVIPEGGDSWTELKRYKKLSRKDVLLIYHIFGAVNVMRKLLAGVLNLRKSASYLSQSLMRR